MISRVLRRGIVSGLPVLFFFLLACLFLWKSLFTGEAFLPAGLLGRIAPYSIKIHTDTLSPWNPLRWDGIAQFYPWRRFASETLHSGLLPLWNPYQFCGTPFVAASQSAVFYPGNFLFIIFSTAAAFGYSAVLHLTLCGWAMYLLLRRLGRSQGASLLAGTVFAYSAWQVAWLQLPTFLDTSCWIPLLFRQIHILIQRNSSQALPNDSRANGEKTLNSIPSPVEGSGDELLHTGQGTGGGALQAIAGIGACVGLMLLAGHLQIAFYGLTAASLWAIALLIYNLREEPRGRKSAWAFRQTTGCIVGLTLGLMLAAPQLLPSIELSHRSHRVAKPSSEAYALYSAYALPASELVMLTLPHFFGDDYDPNNPYWGFYTQPIPQGGVVAIRHNAAETAVYVGILPLVLAGLALLRIRGPNALDRQMLFHVLFFGVLAILALLLALGTPLNVILYFGIPGFNQTGSPARCLVLWAFAIACLTGIGLDTLRALLPTKREVSFLAGGLLLVLAVGLSLAAQSMRLQIPGFDQLKTPLLGEALARITSDWLWFAVMVAGSMALLTSMLRRPLFRPDTPAPVKGLNSVLPSPQSLPWLVPVALLLVILDLFVAGIRINPTAPADWVYPETPGIQFVRERAGHERIFPVNQRWSLLESPPVVLPPNGAMVYRLRDVQGYDSLLTGQYKNFANRFARPLRNGRRDASPLEVGNMVFFQDPNASLTSVTSAAFALTLSPTDSAFPTVASPPGTPVYSEPGEMAIYSLPSSLSRARFAPASSQSLSSSSQPSSSQPSSSQLLSSQSGAASGSNVPIEWIEDDVTRVTVELDAPSAGTLTLADQNYPGWKAFVDGRQVDMLPDKINMEKNVEKNNDKMENGIFRSVAVPMGKHTITFRFEPTSFRLGLYLACLACLALMTVFTTSYFYLNLNKKV